ncbi:MAG: PLP-dependent aminotransferase family protein [Spirochaetales bacterium]|nr:PLP-dependent aminotransferase family protein [Spirochaetales bacterium]
MNNFTETIMFTRGNPAVEALPVDDLSDCAQEIFKKEGKVLFQYGHYSGYGPLRQWIADNYGAALEQVILGNSSMEFLTFLASVMLKKGDRVFVEYPSYDRTITAMKRAGANVVGIRLEDDGVDVKDFELKLKDGCPKFFYTVADFQNPTGITCSLEKRRAVAELAEKHGFYILEDAPYKALRYYGEDVISYRELVPHRVFYINSFSKVLSPGIRVGFLIGPTDLMKEVHAWSENTYIHPALVTEGIVYEYCRRGLLPGNIEKLKNLYRPRLDGILNSLERHLAGQAEWTKPEGGFFVSLFLPDTVDGKALRDNTADFGIKLSKGDNFFVDGRGEQFVRLPFCQMDPEETEEGIRRLKKAILRYSH